MKHFSILCILFSTPLTFYAQQHTQTPPQDWFLLDPTENHVQGTSIEKAYQTILKDKPSKKVTVAVIDTGVDIFHEDLSNKIWINKNEIPDNGIDDDKNGYIDDVHGWNFIGGKDSSVVNDHAEVTREYIRLKSIYGAEQKISKKNKKQYAYWQTVQAKYEKDAKANRKELEEAEQQLILYQGALSTIGICDSIAKKQLQIDAITRTEIEKLNTTNDTLLFVKQTLNNIFQNIGEDIDLNVFLSELSEHVRGLQEYVSYKQAAVLSYDLSYDPRKIVGDDPTNPYEKYYGNNDVRDPSKHGTHVAGIIAADRHNTIGTKGVADNVEIMPVRVVPASGDEHDKDVANGIIYAVDNGAQIINMSFGKYFSPHKEIVAKAIRHAEEKGVLLVHAAGNEATDLDKKDHFPTPQYTNGKVASNWIEVGAISWDENFVADFSNYGKNTVDLFSPGQAIYAPTPNNTYESLQGTSMAAPIVSGVAAVLLAYFPHLTARDICIILNQSGRKFDNLKVNRPGGGETEFKNLSKSGSIINAVEAIKTALLWKHTSIKE